MYILSLVIFVRFTDVTVLDAWTEYQVTNSKNGGRDKFSAIYILYFAAYQTVHPQQISC